MTFQIRWFHVLKSGCFQCSGTNIRHCTQTPIISRREATFLLQTGAPYWYKWQCCFNECIFSVMYRFFDIVTFGLISGESDISSRHAWCFRASLWIMLVLHRLSLLSGLVCFLLTRYCQLSVFYEMNENEVMVYRKLKNGGYSWNGVWGVSTPWSKPFFFVWKLQNPVTSDSLIWRGKKELESLYGYVSTGASN